jgi:DNA-binding transcriptional regulator GbsR (MarR family)
LYKKCGVEIMDQTGKKVDPFDIVDPNKKPVDEDDTKLASLKKLKDDTVLAKVGKSKIAVKDLKEYYKVESLVDESFLAMAKQFGIPLGKVVVYAVKLMTDDMALAEEVKELKYDQKPDIAEKLADLEENELVHAYLMRVAKVTQQEIKQAFDKFIKSIPEEEKNDHEISVKLVFFETREDAAKTLKQIQGGETKFGEIFKEKKGENPPSGIDLGYVKKRGTSPELWGLLKRGASGTCCKEIVELESSQFGIESRNYAIVFIADRRPVTLPTLSNPQERKYFEGAAMRDKAADVVKGHFMTYVESIEGRPMKDYAKDGDGMKRLIIPLVGYVGSPE